MTAPSTPEGEGRVVTAAVVFLLSFFSPVIGMFGGFAWRAFSMGSGLVSVATIDCPHGMPSPASCLTCMEDGPVVDPRSTKPERDHVAATFEAAFEGQCPTCNLPVYPGQMVHRLEPSGTYVHAFGCEPG